MTTVQIACETKDSLPLEKIEPLQGDLKTLAPEDLEKLCGEIMTTGFAFPVLVWRDTRVKRVFCIGGHQRVKALQHLKANGWKDKKGVSKPVEVPRVPIVYVQAKSLKEAKRRVLQDVSQYGKVTTDGLKEFALGAGLELADIFGDFRLPDLDVVNFISGSSDSDKQDLYTKKIEGPVYTPKGEKPTPEELYDPKKANELIAEIEAADLPNDVKTFLWHAALRHVVFDYENIAEFYAHASKEMQVLMENSALVIIDFKKALEKGFVKLSEKIAATYGEQEDDEEE